MSWDEMSRDSLSAAKLLKDSGRWRSAVSRAYYAVYAACTHVLRAEFDVSNAGRPNPSHEQVATMVRHNLGGSRFNELERRDLAKRYRDLLRSRTMADYDHASTVDGVLALACLRNAAAVCAKIGLEEAA